MPDNPLYSMEAINCIKDNVKDAFELENDFPGTSHNIFEQMPYEVAESVKRFIEKH